MTSPQSSRATPKVDFVATPRVEGGLLGALPQLLREHHDALDRWFEQGGDFFEIRIAGNKVKFIARGNLAAEAVVTNRNSFVRSPIFNNGLRMLVGDSVLTLEGEEWRERRRALQPKFHAQVMLELANRIGETLDEVLGALEPGRVELSSLSDKITMGIGLQVLFGHGLDRGVFDELAQLSPIVLARVAVSWVTTKLPTWLPLPGEARFRRALARMDEIMLGLVEDRRRSGEYGDDLLGTLLHMTDAGELDDKGVRDEAVTMLLAGYETTANTLSWTFYTLAQHPEVAERIRAEANAVLGENGRGDVRQLELSMRAFKEGLRLHPAALWVMRLAVEDVTIGGHAIAKGETVVVSTHLVQRHPQDWHEPARFDPDRFLDPPSAHAFIPFGLGQQMCIGKHLALLEGQLALAKFFQRWQLAPVTDHTPKKRISTTLTNADGIYAELRAVD